MIDRPSTGAMPARGMLDASAAPRSIEANGVNAIDEAERKGSPRDLFWPWFAANVSVLGISYGAFLLGFGVSFLQSIAIGIVGIVLSFLLCGVVALAGKRGNAPTMTLSRAAFGIDGNKLPSGISWLLTVGWETVLTSLAVLATVTVFQALGWQGGATTKIVALIVVAALTVAGGVLGFDFIMKMQKLITIVTGLLTVIYVVLVANRIDVQAVLAIPAGSGPAVLGAFVFMMTGLGLGWVNAAADYSRYLPRGSSSAGVVWWTTFGASLMPALLLVFGLLLAGSSPKLSADMSADPIGALATILPIWFLIPFAVVAVLGLIGGAVLDIYSSGLALLNTGFKAPRWVAAGVDGVLMVAGSIYVVFIATDFMGPFQGFLITLGVPVATWAGVFIADIQLRRTDYATEDLFTASGRYGSVQWVSVGLMIVGTIIGWGLVTNTYAEWLSWQGFLLGPLGFGGRTGVWAGANIGVLVALLVGYAGTLLLSRRVIQAQEALPVDAAGPRR